ncbi:MULTISPECIES: hypothetical protein [Kitasatospora]|uniref:Uncharacterized protein n=1 Tax=Kitasatospora cathayae TaxID=3004092 RepID=A0ABY7QD36_9ACTN|nr:hypothetical protein [Kitasatospora sp. HUAS 3-15]WBP90674.1 hypothetical protein O1G21_35605 [Kitasatospora sp. HUAS 3-15]
MSESAHTAAAPNRPVHDRWWRAPLISTAVTLMLLPPAIVFRGLAEMTTDPCTSTDPCPAVPYLAAASSALIAAQIATVLQWPAAWLFRRARVAVSLAPVAALAVEMIAITSAGSAR